MSDTQIIDYTRPCAVYLVRAQELGLVYVGVAYDFERRWAQHRHASWWLDEIVVDEIEVFWMTAREPARQMEAAIINRSHPRYNSSLESGAFQRYLRAAEVESVDPWPVLRVEVHDMEGGVLWTR